MTHVSTTPKRFRSKFSIHIEKDVYSVVFYTIHVFVFIAFGTIHAEFAFFVSPCEL